MEWTSIINISLTIIAGFLSVIAAFYTARQREIERQFKAMWKRIDDNKKDISVFQKQLDVLQGEHNVLSCSHKKGR
jgi:hypothetical protein